MTDDEIWDEHRWEAFLRESDRRLDRYMDLIFSFMADHPPPEPHDAAGQDEWRARLRRYIQARGLRFDEEILAALLAPGDESEEPGAGVAGGFFADPDDGDLDEGEQELVSFRDLDVYERAFRLASDVLDWTDALPGDLKDSTLVQFCAYITQIPANIAKGHGIGYERDMIGGNIACTKRGITAANAALDLLREMKSGPYMDAPTYARFYEQTYEVRNALGLYIQALRGRFDLGVD